VAFGGSWKDWTERTLNEADILKCETILAVSDVLTGSVIDGLLLIRDQVKQARCVVGTNNLFDVDKQAVTPIGIIR